MTMINNALTGSLAAQVALGATSQNIANIQTKGYTRQGAVLTALPPAAGRLAAGNGVEVSALQRFSDSYKSQQMWRANSELGRYTQTQPYLTQLERVMGDTGSSLSAGVDDFFAALNAADVDPASSPLRQQVVSAAEGMAQHFNSINNVISNQLLSVRQQRSAIVPQANEAIASIATLNQKIISTGAAGSNTSALVDARDQAIDALAGLVALEVTDQLDGSRTVALKSGPPLVVGALGATLSATSTMSGSQNITLRFVTSDFTLDGKTLGGQLGGLGEFEDNVLLPLQQSVSDIAENIATSFNDQAALGYDITGAPGAPPFVFSALGVGGSGLLQVTAGFKAADLAFAASPTNPGNSDNLFAMIGFKSATLSVTSIGSVLLGDADTQLMGKLAIDSQQNQAAMTTAATVRDQSVADWQSTSGVSKDEEAINLVEFQNMYQANMKVISIANALFDATLEMMR